MILRYIYIKVVRYKQLKADIQYFLLILNKKVETMVELHTQISNYIKRVSSYDLLSTCELIFSYKA